MKPTIRLSLLISAAALFASACTPVPIENQSTPYGTGSYNTMPTNVSNAPVPEAGPLSENTYAANTPAAPQHPAATAPQVPAATATPVATVPQVPAATNTASYTPPATTTTANGPYDSYAANTTPAPANNNYGGSNNYAANNSYTSYGTTSPSQPNTANTYAANTSSGNNYYSGGNDSYTSAPVATAAASSSASGNSAVQVFATVSQAKAERIRQDIASQGVNAIVDQVDGLFKVRVPYATPGEARANLTRVRHVSGTPGAFVTTR